MKRSFAVCLMIGASLASAGCGASPDAAPRGEVANDGWVAGPRIERVARSGAFILVGGQAAPLGRVVLTGPDGVAYAAGADDAGRFDVRVPAPARDSLLAIEAQVGQVAYPAPYRLLVTANPDGPIALLAIGVPTRRIDGTGLLDAVDSDGRAGFVSGRSDPNTEVLVARGGAVALTADETGRWSLATSGDTGVPVQVGSQTFVPPAMTVTSDGVLERAGLGWQIGWRSADGARQVTWFPDTGTDQRQ